MSPSSRLRPHLVVIYVPVAGLETSGRVTRTHSKKQIGKIARSIREFGFNCPVLVGEDNAVVSGHGRLAAARELGLSRPPSINKKGYKIGYKKPPREHRWVRGESGNPRGRPKKKKNRDMFEILADQLSREITVVENGKESKITKREAIMIQTINKAMQGDKKALEMIRKFDEGVATERQRREEPQTHGVLLVGRMGEPSEAGRARGLTWEQEAAEQQAKHRGETPEL